MKTEVSVKYVRLTDESGCRPVLGVRGKSLAHCVAVDLKKVYSASVPVQWFDKATNVLRHQDPYPIKRYLEMIEERISTGKSVASPKAIQILKMAHDPDHFDEAQLENLADEPAPSDFIPDDGFADAVRDALELTKRRNREDKIDTPRQPRPGKPAPKPAITSRKARQPAVTASPEAPKRGRGRPPGSAGAGLIARIAADLGADPAHLRKACRAAGMKAPYEDEKPIRAAWKKHAKT